jgi:hypothetical protein
VEAAEATDRAEAVDDIKFGAGDQWPDDIKASRQAKKRPCLTINKVNTFIFQITNEQRQNRPSINVSPVGDKSDIQTAQMLKGMIRQIERLSHADIAYDTGFESAVRIGWGYWRLITEYEYEKSFDQCIKIERIRNPFRVYMDPDHQSPTGQDAQWCFITDLVTREDFKTDYPDADPVEWQEGTTGDENLWCTQTHVRLAEYFCFETKNRTLVALSNGHIGWEDKLNADIRKQIESGVVKVVNEREVPVKQVKWFKLTSKDILDEKDWPGKWIPVVKDIGIETDIEGNVSRMGLTRGMKDPQRMYNYWCTSETEQIALMPKAPYIIEEGQLEGHEGDWAKANNDALPYLTYKGSNVGGKPVPPPQRQQFAGPPAGIIQAKIGAAQDMQAVTGVRWDATMQERMHDESGKALRELKRVGDIGNFHYVDNLARSLKFTGEILIDLIPKIYDTKRILTILREDDSQEQVTIDPTLPKAHEQREEGENVVKLYNPNVGEYAVAVTIGPNFATKRQEAADSMLTFMQAVPPAAPLIADLIAKNMDWPGAEEIYSRLQTLLPPGLLDQRTQNLPPEAKGLIANLTQQMAQMKQERDQAVSMLGDKDKDRQIEIDKINKDFEAKMTDIATGFQEEVMKLQAQQGEPGVEAARLQQEFDLKLREIQANAEIAREKMAAEYDIQFKKMQLESDAALHKAQLENDVKHRELDGKQQEIAAKLGIASKANEDKNKLGNAQLKQMGELSKAKLKQDEKIAEAKVEAKPAEKPKPKKRKITMTGPSGRVYRAEIEE